MATSDVVAIPTTVDYVSLEKLRLGRSSQQTVGRLTRFWDARNIKKNGEFMGIVLLLLDEKDAVIHCFIPAARANQYREHLREGLIYRLSRFEVARCSNLYRITEHPFLIRFLPETNVVPLTSFAKPIPHEKFMLRRHDQLQALANTNVELPDVVGQIRFVQGANLTDPTSTQRLVIRLELALSTPVSLSLWDDAAGTFRTHLADADPINSVVLVTTVNPKLFGGKLFLNSTPATRFFFDTNIAPIKEFTQSLPTEAPTPFDIADTADSVNKYELVPIRYLYKYISEANDQTQDADFLCKARIVCVLQNSGLSYISCSSCSRKLDKYGSTLRCSRCVTPVVTGVVRYRVELAVHDGDDSATFVVFDKEMTKLTTKTAATLTLESGIDDTNALLNCLEVLAGKKYLFKLRLTPYNFSLKHRTFTVTTMTLDESEDEVLTLPSMDNLHQNGPAVVEFHQPNADGVTLSLETGAHSNDGKDAVAVHVGGGEAGKASKRSLPDGMAGADATKNPRG